MTLLLSHFLFSKQMMMKKGKPVQILLVPLLLITMEVATVAPDSTMDTQLQALLVLKKDFIDEYNLLYSWRYTNKNCCNWNGVQCKNGRVIWLSLRGNLSLQLGGKINPSLLQLKHLEHLDLSYNHFDPTPIPDFIGSLPKLTYLNISNNGFQGRIPPQLGNLWSLRIMDLSFNTINSTSLEWVSGLISLTWLDLSFINLTEVNDWPQAINKLMFLTHLDMSGTFLHHVAHDSVIGLNFSAPLAFLHLSYNNLESSLYQWILNFKDSLVEINLEFNQLRGPIPFKDFCSLKSLNLASNPITENISDVFMSFRGCTQKVLEILDLSKNQLFGSLPGSLSSFSNLKSLLLYGNRLNGTFPEGFQLPPSLDVLHLGTNEIKGRLPDLKIFYSLKILFLHQNLLTGTIDEGLGFLSMMEVLDLSSNFINGTMTESHFSNLISLKKLDLSDNSLTFSINSDWVPPFQLQVLNLRNCKLGQHFPAWVQTQKNYSVLDISGAGISGTIPSKFWKLSLTVLKLNLSSNSLNGTLPSLKLKTENALMLDLSSNNFSGQIPLIFHNMALFKISRNSFSGPITILCDVLGPSLQYLDLSYNQFSGEVPDCWNKFEDLILLRLEHNELRGIIPKSMGSLTGIRSLHLGHNKLTGELSPALRNCTELEVLDLGENQLFSEIPPWMGAFWNLGVLSLRSNRLHGIIPIQLCHLQSVGILDFSNNNISGTIPTCISNLTTMIEKTDISSDIFDIYISQLSSFNGYVTLSESMIFMWKGKESEHRSTLVLLKIIDFSSNGLIGVIPDEITTLVELVSLNLSRNSLQGSIPSEVGKLKFLESLDLSRNHLSGKIPRSLSQIDDLSIMDLSHNNFSGNIPISTQLQSFDASVYIENPLLCGIPLRRKCKMGDDEDVARGNPSFEGGDENGFDVDSEWISAGLGFGVGFAVACGMLLLNGELRDDYFHFVKEMMGRAYVTIAFHFATLCRE